MKIICTHWMDCSIPGTYSHSEPYLELFGEDGTLLEIIPPDTQPENLVCTECGSAAYIEADETLKKNRRKKASIFIPKPVGERLL